MRLPEPKRGPRFWALFAGAIYDATTTAKFLTSEWDTIKANIAAKTPNKAHHAVKEFCVHHRDWLPCLTKIDVLDPNGVAWPLRSFHLFTKASDTISRSAFSAIRVPGEIFQGFRA